jgi:hypothetical protein
MLIMFDFSWNLCFSYTNLSSYGYKCWFILDGTTVDNQYIEMGQYSRIVHNDLILSPIYPNILAISWWEDQTQVFQSLRLCNKAWKKLIDSSSQWLNTKFCLLVLHFEWQATLEVLKKLQWKNCESINYYMYKGEDCMSFDDFDGTSNDLQ